MFTVSLNFYYSSRGVL